MYSYEHEMKEKQEQHIRFIDIFKKKTYTSTLMIN